METIEVAIPIAVFMAEPPHRAPTVTLSPEECGYGKNLDGNPAPRDNIKFGVDGRYETSSDEMARILRNHSQNTANGGNIFFEVPVEVMRHGRALDNSNPASIPDGGLTDDDAELVNALAKTASLPTVPPKAMDGLCQKMKAAVERFRVANFDVPEPTRRVPIIRGRLLELMEILEAQGIRPEVPENAG